VEERERNEGQREEWRRERKNVKQRKEWRKEKGMEERERNGGQRKQLKLDRNLIWINWISVVESKRAKIAFKKRKNEEIKF
jgi:hypothetical protein